MAKPVILCVDDEKDILTSLKGQLKRHFSPEYTIETAQDGEEALEVLEELLEDNYEIPVVLSDQIMPGMKGDELLIKMHEQCPTALKILLTGQADADAVGNAVNRAKLYRYITKPWDEEDLIMTVKEAARSYFQDKMLEERNQDLLQANKDLALAHERLLTINQIMKYVSSTLDLQQVSQKFIEKAVETIKPEGAGSILLFDQVRNVFRFYASFGLDPKYIQQFEIEFSPDKLYAYDIVVSKQGKILEYEEIQPFHNEQTLKLHYGKTCWQQLITPIVSDNLTIGLVTLSTYSSESKFNEMDIAALENIASSLSNHFENARLYTHLKSLNNAYERFVPQEFVKILRKSSILDVKLGDQIRQHMTILFSDIRSFTSLSEELTPEENFRFINSYLSHMGPLVRKNNGFIDKFIGDSIMALFPESADDAIHAGISMLQRLREYNEGRKRAGYIPIRIGIGINSGMLMLGTLGEEDRMESTVISDSVNLASRMEKLTKIYGTPLLISEECLKHLSHPEKFQTRFVDVVAVQGKSHPIKLIEILNAYDPEVIELKLSTVDIFQEGWQALLDGNNDAARSCFEKCVAIIPNDLLFKIYLDRC